MTCDKTLIGFKDLRSVLLNCEIDNLIDKRCFKFFNGISVRNS